jgi:hypothetical protein
MVSVHQRDRAIGFSATDLLDVWDRCAPESPPHQRALLLLARSHPELTWDALADLPIGVRDRRLLELRTQLFGPVVSAVEGCPSCGARLEVTLDTSALLAADAHGPHLGSVVVGEYAVAFRLPTSRDLEVLVFQPSIASARAALLARCVTSAEHNSEPIGVATLPVDVIDAVEQAMDAADPLANIELQLHCLDCGNTWPVRFDVVSYLWSEIGIWAGQILREVHRLAAAYGWSEREILSLSPGRRRRYLEMINGG